MALEGLEGQSAAGKPECLDRLARSGTFPHSGVGGETCR